MSPSDPDDNEDELKNDGGTRIDLGDDLLEKTAVLVIPGSTPAKATSPPPGASAPAPAGVPPPATHPLQSLAQPLFTPDAEISPAGPVTLEQIPDHLESARILMGENLMEDAKKLLRKILLVDPGRVVARKMLEEIHEIELKQIFGESDTPRRRFGRREPQTAVEVSADVVMRELDHDLKLGIFEPGGQAGSEPRETQLSLFRDREAMDEFGARMDRDLAALPPAERVDLGIAFLEMGLHDLAARHFQAAINHLMLEHRESAAPDPLLAATGLLAYALILGGRSFEATIILQPLLNDVDIERARKVDLVYLMGRAFEAMGKPADARQWYLQAAEIEPHYRDTDERLRKAAGR